MPVFMVTLKDNAPPSELEKAKEAATSQGGKITHEYTLMKGFSVEYPAGTVTTLQSNDHVDVEADQEVKTQ
ncbi:hypothetical protein MMC10_003263 [Thelotrema lepadinum]|nr:hypothetical protein [Thelotrema lepadinum]